MEAEWSPFNEGFDFETMDEEVVKVKEEVDGIISTTDDDVVGSTNYNKNQMEQQRLGKLWETIKSFDPCEKPLPELKFPVKVRNRQLTDINSVYECNAWDNVEWDEQMEKNAKEAVEKNSLSTVEEDKKALLEKDAYVFWDKFYGIHQNKFFRDRNWLFCEFPELKSPFGCSVSSEDSEIGIKDKRIGENYPGEKSKFKVLEIGCGAGNTIFPLLSANNHPETYVYCCDFSTTAVDIIKNHEKFQSQRCTPFTLDVTVENPVTPFPLESIDVITSIFVLSAISPEKFRTAIKNLYRFLKPGGLILFRDYGRYDMAQLRFKDGRCLSENFYMRGDGTRVYFFNPEEVEDLFQEQGFSKESLNVDKRLQVNRSRQLKMYRVWIQAKFRKN